MAKLKGKGFVMTALVAGATSFLSKKENRDKTMKLLNDVKSRVGTYFNSQEGNGKETKYNSIQDVAETAAGPDSTKIRENNMIAESGLQTAVIYYNENDQKNLN